eukprot:scaffold20747_cov113-Isochrysis_galbana.AAC.1
MRTARSPRAPVHETEPAQIRKPGTWRWRPAGMAAHRRGQGQCAPRWNGASCRLQRHATQG